MIWLFSLLVFSENNTWFCKLDPQAETLHLKLLLVGLWVCVGVGWGECSPGEVNQGHEPTNQGQGGWEWSDAKIRGHKQAASTSSPSVTWFHTPPHVGTMRFSVRPVSYLYTPPHSVMRFSYTQTDPERKLHVFSDDGYVFTVFNNWWSGARSLAWLTVFPAVTKSRRSRSRSALWGQGALQRAKGSRQRDGLVCACVFEFCINLTVSSWYFYHTVSLLST